ncbi:Threonine dehydrogenase and related Zn-dependent dehydrogenase [Rubrobacter radiotolerans]|nr:Threonine dehydrogenase and related Zn-dependent dehydrogenase [Rubrobacter radiotolerans]SMC07679.1 L-iditol 2-dehydrogenase [Rubrobacter radiotolerans DSM 5868]
MKAAVFEGVGRLEVREVGTPEAGPGEVLVKVGANTLCGTDLRILRGEKTAGIKPPAIIGHEVAGHIVEVGDGVRGFEAGAQVTITPMIPCGRCFYCRRDMENVCENVRAVGYEIPGGLGEYMKVPAEAIEAGCLFVAEEELSPERLALVEPLSCCVYGQVRSPVEAGDTVLVIGAGPIGLFHVQLALLAGAETVIVSQRSEHRRRLASQFGAHVVVDPSGGELPEVVAEHTQGRGVDATFLCIGVPQLVNEALRLTRKGGRVNLFAGFAGAGLSEIEANLIHYNELRVTGQTGARREDFAAALDLVVSGRIETERMITARFPLEEAPKAMEAASGREGIKVAVIPGYRDKT